MKNERQIFGAALGSPVSAIVANLFMEWLEKEAIATAPLDLGQAVICRWCVRDHQNKALLKILLNIWTR